MSNGVLNEDGSIANERVRQIYEAICDSPIGFDRKSYPERVDSAEAFLRRVSKMTEQQLERWGFK